MKTSHDQALREHLLYLLKDGGAHAKFEDVIDIPAELRGKKSSRRSLHGMDVARTHANRAVGYSRIQPGSQACLARLAQGYWPKSEAPSSSSAWKNSIESFSRELKAMENLVTNPKTDLFAKIPWGDGQTILREVLLVADHNAYHLGARDPAPPAGCVEGIGSARVSAGASVLRNLRRCVPRSSRTSWLQNVPEDDAYAVAPAFIDRQQRPFNLGRNVMQNYVSGGVTCRVGATRKSRGSCAESSRPGKY